MRAGGQVFDASGAVVLDLGTRVCRMLTIADIGTATTGSVAVPGVTTGSVVVSPLVATQNRARPAITKTTTGISWDYTGVPTGDRDPSLRVAIQVF